MEKILALLSGEIKGYFGYVFIGMFGGLAHKLHLSNSVTANDIIKNVVVSAFSGLMGGILCEHFFPNDYSLSFLSAGIFGFIGGLSILYVMHTLAKKAGVEIPDNIQHLNMSGPNIIASLLKQKLISLQDYCSIVEGDFSSLHTLLDNDKLSGPEFDIVQQWQKSIPTKESNGQLEHQ